MQFDEPTSVYTAETNVELHLVVEMLRANNIESMAIEDQSGASLWAFGTISQFHKPKVWVDKPDEVAAIKLIAEFESRKLKRNSASDEPDELQATCEECDQETSFPAALNGTTQDCPKCGAYMDVGELDWDQDFGTPLEED